MKEISPKETFDLLRTGQAIGVDVRELDEWEAGRAPYVQLNPKSAFDATRVNRELPIVFICRSGNRSSQVASAFESITGIEVFNMSGGMLAWQNAGLPLESSTSNGGNI